MKTPNISETPSTSKSTPEQTIDISQGFLTWPQVKELLEIADKRNAPWTEIIHHMIWIRQKYLTVAKEQDDVLQDYYKLLKAGKL